MGRTKTEIPRHCFPNVSPTTVQSQKDIGHLVEMAFPGRLRCKTLLDLRTFYVKSLSVELATHPTFMFKNFPEAISIHNNSLGLPWCFRWLTLHLPTQGAGLIPDRGTVRKPHAQRNQNIKKCIYIVTNSIKTCKKQSTSLNTIRLC